MPMKIKNALISLSDKKELDKLLKILKKFKINIISSGGTFREIKKLGYKCTEVSKFTKFKEMLDGRVKTLHPKIHAGILSKRTDKKHFREMKKTRFQYIDLVVVNFYPFQETIRKTKNFKKIMKI
jgi:AICAR transformylase/IMP cyclohydrolase PurH (only IMP cyclohydrolase domain in Aful)